MSAVSCAVGRSIINASFAPMDEDIVRLHSWDCWKDYLREIRLGYFLLVVDIDVCDQGGS